MRRLLTSIVVLITTAIPVLAKDNSSVTESNKLVVTLPGHKDDGSVLLPNQWSLRPAGKQVQLGDFPINVAVQPQGKFAAVLHSGYSKNSVMIVDLSAEKVVTNAPLAEALYGITFSPDGSRLFCSGASKEVVHSFQFKDGLLSDKQDIRLRATNEVGIVSGVAINPDGTELYVANLYGQS